VGWECSLEEWSATSSQPPPPFAGFAAEFLSPKKCGTSNSPLYILSAEYTPERMARRKFAAYNELTHLIKKIHKLVC